MCDDDTATLDVMTASDRASFDRQMMSIALGMAERGLGQTAPNPSVGAVIADEAAGIVIARAVTAPGGRPHAETQAIADAGARAKGATIYVTLEPCSHFGKTPPCADAIVAAGLKRAVVAIEDPDPRVAGRGLDRLRAAGLDVTRGVEAAAARWVTRGHIVRVTERRPFVTLKLALDAMGQVPRGTGVAPTFVTSEAARAHGHLLRAKADAILVGSGTIAADDAVLTCRLPGLAARSPVRVVLARTLDIAVTSKIVASARDVPLWVFAARGVDANRKAALEALGVEVIEVSAIGGRLWLSAVLEELVGRGITRLLVEGGPAIWRSFADAALVDEVALYIAQGPRGGATDEGTTRGDPVAIAEMARQWLGPLPLVITDHRRVGPDTLWRLGRPKLTQGW
ncbi:MAG: bifunctional diaminohydroxyphosphoribosylaminopyrimidine deaminase/5-amino-6-(5-phosphoribosylamino)uracil reductase RibD [Hyphomicrobium sp.]